MQNSPDLDAYLDSSPTQNHVEVLGERYNQGPAPETSSAEIQHLVETPSHH